MSREIRDRVKYESDSKWFCDWHREDQHDNTATMIDLDGCGYCPLCLMPIYLVEATDTKTRKNARVTEKLGELLGGVDVFVFYRDTEHHPGQFLVHHRTSGYRYGWISEDRAWQVLTSVRRTHYCQQRNDLSA